MEIIYALKENIGNPELFAGRKMLLANFGHWTNNIRKEIGKSRALLSRRKKGKTVFLRSEIMSFIEKSPGLRANEINK